MPIQVLSPRLANQIAAGEVVERPASVLKELLENSLDAGATQIEITVEKGGHKRIQIRDNGQGIPKDELALSLERHATSKIETVDDLGKIESLGFRGEALASISSVSRLTLTSRPETQKEAWQVIAEGRDMIAKITPASHPVGTTVEVVDLFFNTPARRRFLRTEKTEFGHIDELVKRVALSRFDVQFSLIHNGKQVKLYRQASSEPQQLKRVSQICGRQFGEQAAAFSAERTGIAIQGWLAPPHACAKQNDKQFCYINGRMIRDRLINHAIRESYGHALPTDLQPTYVLFLTLPPDELDVNVHPTKHEVRFHQSRWVHDFVVSTLTDTFSQLNTPSSLYDATEAIEQPIRDVFSPVHTTDPTSTPYRAPSLSSGSGGHVRDGMSSASPAYPRALLPDLPSPSTSTQEPLDHMVTFLSCAKGRYALLQHETSYYWIDVHTQCPPWQGAFNAASSKPLLLPKRLPMSEDYAVDLDTKLDNLVAIGIGISFTGDSLLIRSVNTGISLHWLPHLLDAYLAQDHIATESPDNTFQWLSTASNLPLSHSAAEDILLPLLDQQSVLNDWFTTHASLISLPEAL